MQQLKFENNNSQELLLNKFGEVLESDNQLFPVQKMANLTVLECFPLVASMFDSFLNLEIGDIPVTVPGVSPSCGFLDGFYDFSFSKIGTVEDFQIKWIIVDCTDNTLTLKMKCKFIIMLLSKQNMIVETKISLI